METGKCEHAKFRCTDGHFFCLLCGSEIPDPFEADSPKEEEKTKKPSRKRATPKAD